MKMLTKQHVPMKIAILGGKSVGKTAVSVRFLTKRYIGEYNSDTDHLYQCPLNCAQMKGSIQLLDVTGDCQKKTEDEMKEILCWANGIMLVYSVCDRHSFNLVCRLLNETARVSPQISVVLVGNKQDLEPGRKVDFDEGKTLASKFSAQFFEISAADHCFGVSKAFEGLLQQVSKSPRLFNKNQLILCSYSNNVTRLHQNHSQSSQKKSHERSLTSPLQLLGSVLSVRHRKYSFTRKTKLVKQSYSSQSSPHERSPSDLDAIKAVKNRSHSAPQFLVPRKENSFCDCTSPVLYTG